jgi:hypothetical protein
MPPPSPVEAAAANLAWLWYLYVILHSWAFMNSAKDHHIMIIWNRFQIVSWTKCRSSLSEVQKKNSRKTHEAQTLHCLHSKGCITRWTSWNRAPFHIMHIYQAFQVCHFCMVHVWQHGHWIKSTWQDAAG